VTSFTLRTPDWRRAPLLLLLAASASAQSLVPGSGSSARAPGSPPAQEAPAPPRPPVPPKPPAPAPTPRHALDVSDPAPKLEGLRWLKGEPVSEWTSGTTYVVEFWAPWCPWCRESLSTYAEIVRLYADKNVKVVAVAVWPKKSQPDMAADFVADQAEEFPYPVAADVGERAAKAWLDAADALIPTAFVVDGEGRIAWIGDPRQGLEKGLAKAVGGSPSEDNAPERVRNLRQSRYGADLEKAEQLLRAQDWQALAKISREMYDSNPWMLPDLAVYHYISLVMLGRTEEAKEWGERLYSQDFSSQANGLNLLAWYPVAPDSAIPREHMDLDLALRAARRADMLSTHKNPFILDTLARVLYLRGELVEALHVQLQAVERASDYEGKDATMLRKELAERLDEYEAAADASADEHQWP